MTMCRLKICSVHLLAVTSQRLLISSPLEQLTEFIFSPPGLTCDYVNLYYL